MGGGERRRVTPWFGEWHCAGGEEVDGAGEKGIGSQRGRILPKYRRLQRQVSTTEATRARRRGRHTARKSTEPRRKGSAVREEEEGADKISTRGRERRWEEEREATGYSVVWGITKGAGGEEVDGAGEKGINDQRGRISPNYRRLQQQVPATEATRARQRGRRTARKSTEPERKGSGVREEEEGAEKVPQGGGKGDGRRREAAGYSVVLGITQSAGSEEVDGAGEKGIDGQRERISPKYGRLQR